MTTLKNVKEIVLKGKNIRDVDTTSITMPTPVYENGEIKTDPQTGEIIYNPSLDTLKTDTLLTETSLPIAYSLKDKELDPTSPNFKNEVLTLSAATELKTKTKSDTLKILENSEHQKQYQFADNSPESFGENENKDALSVGIFKDTLTSGIDFSKEHNSEISDNFMTEKVFKDRYVYSKLHFNENNLSDVDLTDTTTKYIKSTITYSQPSTDNIIFNNTQFSIYTNIDDNNTGTTINILIDGMKIQIVDDNNDTSRFTINECILATYSTMTDSRYCQTDNINNTYNVPENIFNATLLENGLYEGVWNKSIAPKPFKINYGIINNERVFKAIAEDKNIIDVYTHFDENNEIVYHKLVLYSSSTKAEHIIYKYNFEKYDSSKTYTTYTETLNGPDEKNSNITFRNLQIKYTYTSQPVIVDVSQIPSELLPEVKHKLLTTEALNNAYVNSLNLKNQEWYDENKDKLVTVEAMKDVEISSEKEHLQIINVNGVNKYQFGNSEPIEFDSSETSTKPLSVNVLADTKTTPFEFSKTEAFNNNLMTEKVLEDTYINDSLKFASTLTTSDENTEIENTTIDPLIEHKLLTTDALNNTYVSDKLIFSDTLTDNPNNINYEVIDYSDDNYNEEYPINNNYHILDGSGSFFNGFSESIKEQYKFNKYNYAYIWEDNGNLYDTKFRYYREDVSDDIFTFNKDTIYFGYQMGFYSYDINENKLYRLNPSSGDIISILAINNNIALDDYSGDYDLYYLFEIIKNDESHELSFNFYFYSTYYDTHPITNITSDDTINYDNRNYYNYFDLLIKFTKSGEEIKGIKRKVNNILIDITNNNNVSILTDEKTFGSITDIESIDPNIKNKLLTSNVLDSAYVNSLDMDNNEWMDENKYKLITVNALKDLKITGEDININDMLLYNKYECEIIENEEADDLTGDLYDESLFKVKMNCGKLKLYYDNTSVYVIENSSINENEITWNYNSGQIKSKYRVVDKYYGFIFDVYCMANEFIVSYTVSGQLLIINVNQYFAILKNGTQINSNVLDKGAILKYCNVKDGSVYENINYIIKYSNNEEYSMRANEYILGDDLLMENGNTIKINILDNYPYRDIIYDDNKYVGYEDETNQYITFTMK